MNATDQRFVPLGFSTWLLWVAACGFAPVANQVLFTAAQKNVLPEAEHAALIRWSMFAVMAAMLFLPRMAEVIALRRIAPGLGFWSWLLACVLGLLAHGALLLGASAGLPPQILGANAALLSGASSAADIAAHLLLATVAIIAYAAAGALPASILLGARTGMHWWRYLAAAVAGAVMMSHNPLGGYFGLNGMDWRARFFVLADLAEQGALAGAVSGLVFAALTRGALRRGFFTRALAASLVLLALTGLSKISLPEWQRLGRGIARTISSAPAQDVSTGEPILVEVHDAEFPSFLHRAPYVEAHFAPDSRSVLVSGPDRRLSRIDLASGHSLGTFGDRLRLEDQRSVAWRADGAQVAIYVQTETIVSTPSPHVERASKIMLFDVATAKLLANFEASAEGCLGFSSEPRLMESSDRRALWLACAPKVSNQPSEPVALKLSLPDLRLQAAAHLGDSPWLAPSGLFQIDGSARLWSGGGPGAPLVVRDLDRDRIVTKVPAEELATQARGGTLQRGVFHADQGRLELVFCHWLLTKEASGMSDCRSLDYDMRTGALAASRDWIAPNDERTTSGGIQVSSDRSDARRTGVLIVTEAATGRVMQRIVSRAQKPVGFSPDGKWFLAYRIDDSRIRIYRVDRP